MSFIHLSSMGIQSLDIMADSVDREQMLLTSNSRLDWRDSLYSLVPNLSALTKIIPLAAWAASAEISPEDER